MNPLVLSLDTPDITLENAGGKGANLNRLIGAGFPTPPGFVVTTAVYRAFVHANGLNDRIVALARATRADAPDSFESASQSIRQLFDKSPIPDDIAQPILRAYTNLQSQISNPFAVAVRSSATAEDLPDASFAGQQETYLNVRDETALMPAVKRCWERASVPMPPSDPTDPDDPQTNLDTLAAIATAKWLASEDEAAEVARLQAHFAALNSENADLNRENTKLLEKWSEAKARDPQQVEYLTSLAKAEARLAEVERALPGVEHLDIAVKALRQMGFFDSASAMLGLRNEISP